MKNPSYLKKPHFLKKLYKKLMKRIYKDRIKVVGDSNIKGPAIIASTHHAVMEAFVLEAVFKEHLYFIADIAIEFWKLGKRIKYQNIPVLRQIMDRVGLINIDRKKIEKYKPIMLHKSLLVLENNGIIGIMPGGGIDRDPLRKEIGSKGASYIAQQASIRMNKKIPIFPVGVKKSGRKYIVKIGAPIFPKPDGDSSYRTAITNKIIKEMEKLAE